jgi:hypothetical protein
MIFLILSSCHKNVSQSFLAAPARGGLAYNLHQSYPHLHFRAKRGRRGNPPNGTYRTPRLEAVESHCAGSGLLHLTVLHPAACLRLRERVGSGTLNTGRV